MGTAAYEGKVLMERAKGSWREAARRCRLGTAPHAGAHPTSLPPWGWVILGVFWSAPKVPKEAFAPFCLWVSGREAW